MSVQTSKNQKDVIVVNCNDIPEGICVETRFITQAAAKQKKYDQIFHVINKNGNFELTRQDQLNPLIKSITITKPPTVTLSLPAKPVPTVQSQSNPLMQQTTGTIVPPSTSLTNFGKKEFVVGSGGNLVSNLTVGKGLNPAMSIPMINTSQRQPYMNASVVPAPIQTPIAITNTLSTAINNDQMQQTQVSALNMKSVAVQCKMDDEMDDIDEWTPISDESPASGEEEMKNFLKFVNDNSTQYKDFKECLICGEVSKTNKYFYGHMSVHQGPKVLCFKCGKCMDNEHMLLQHNCRKAKKLERVALQCPHHACSVVAISRLELYDHINEHDNSQIYKCSACVRTFSTSQEFLRHLLIRAKCYTSAKRKRFRVYGLESQKDRLCRVRVFTLHTFKKRTTLVKSFLTQRAPKHGVCKICLKTFKINSAFKLHRVKCLKKFRKRLLRKKLNA